MLLGCMNLKEKWAIYSGVVMNESFKDEEKGSISYSGINMEKVKGQMVSW